MIDLFKEIDRALKQKYHDGATQQDIANKAGVSQVHICNLLNKKRKIEDMSLKTFTKLFPDASITINGDAPTIHAPQNHGNVIGINNGSIGADCFSAVMDKILASKELSSDEKIKFMQVLKK